MRLVGITANKPPALDSPACVEASVKLTLEDGTQKTFKPYEVDSVSAVAPELPTFTSFKFNNKFNEQLIGDSEGIIGEDGIISLKVIGIGRRLTASFKTSDEGASKSA